MAYSSKTGSHELVDHGIMVHATTHTHLLLCDHQLPTIRHLLLSTCNHHLANLDRGAGNAAPKLQVTADHVNIGEHLFEIPGDGDFLHRIGQFAVLDPNSGGSPRTVD